MARASLQVSGQKVGHSVKMKAELDSEPNAVNEAGKQEGWCAREDSNF